MTTFVSRGGMGDTWIAFIKILSAIKNDVSMHNWIHFHRRSIHGTSISELMALMPSVDLKEARHCPNPGQSKEETDRLVKNGAKFIKSSARDCKEPCPDLSFLAQSRPISDPYIVINPEAGKPANWRAIGRKALQDLVDSSNKKIVFVGGVPKHTNISVKGALNLCGQTSIFDLINWIYHSDEFFAYDGVIAYMAMAMKKPGRVIFTHQEKRNGASDNYMCSAWKNRTKIGFAEKKIQNTNQVKWT